MLTWVSNTVSLGRNDLSLLSSPDKEKNSYERPMKITVNPEYDKQVPRLSQQEYSSLKQDIVEHGQLYPIIVNQDGVVLDGHHRFRICQELGIEVEYKVKEFEDKVEEQVFVTKSNLSGKGRHLKI